MKTTLQTIYRVAALVALAVTGAFGAAHANHYILPCREKCGDVGAAPQVTVTIVDVGRWTAIGPDGANVVALVIDPATPSTAFAGTLGAGVLKTTDGGASWATTSVGISSANVSALAIDPSIPSTLYAGTDAGVFKSIDGGLRWAPANGGLPVAPQGAVKAIALDPTAPATVYAGTAGGLFKTVNGGTNWTAIGANLAGLSPVIITIDPSYPSTLYLGVDDYQDDAGYGLLKSTDAGTSWARIYTSTPYGDGGAPSVAALAIDPRSSSRLYLIAGSLTDFHDGGYQIADALLISSDGGATWSRANLSPPDNDAWDYPVSLTIDPSTPATIYVGTANGLLARSTDAGDHWTFPANGPRLAGVNILAAAASGSPTLYAGGRNGISRSADQAAMWTQAALGVRTIGVGPTVVDPTAPSTIYANAGGILVKTTDSGAHWVDASVGLPNQRLSLLAIDPLAPSTVYALEGAMYKTTDAGAHWEPPQQFLNGVQAFAIAPSQPSTLYIGVNSVGIMKSLDGGRSGSYVNNGFSAVGPYASALAVDPTTPDVVYVASRPTGRPNTDAKIFKSTDGAAHWRQVPIALPTGTNITSLVIDPATPSVMYATYADFGVYGVGGVFKSVDSGETWVATQSGLPQTWVWTLVIDPSLPSRLYAATNAGVFRSTDGGKSWRPFNSGLGSAAVYDLSIDRSGSLLRASTAFGLYECKVETNATPGAAINYQGLWWASPPGSESGWGLNVAHQGDAIFATWFTHDANGNAWYMSMTAFKTGPNTFAGTLYRTTGPPLDANPFDPNQVQRIEVGNGTLTFTDGNNGTFAYTVNGISQTKVITRQVFGPLPTCAWGGLANLALATNYQDLWWAAGGVESGWGINFTHQGDVIFATWFTYDFTGTALPLSATLTKGGPGIYSGSLIKTAGPAFSAVPFNPNAVTRTVVGTATATFSNGNAATFSYQVSLGGQSVSRTKAIERQVFSAPGTFCQ